MNSLSPHVPVECKPGRIHNPEQPAGPHRGIMEMMSAFLAHDLKNIASVLSLTLKNMTHYHDDQQFREDAIRALADGVNKINRIIQRLSGLPSHVKLQREPVDFRHWFEEMMKSLDVQMPGTLEWHPPTDRFVPMDAEQVRTVVHNLVANAREASRPGQPVRVFAEHHHGAVLIRVRDDGTGMSREFIATRLFMPFQTTKPNGMGIGLCQARMIVEAHGGRIDVDSAPGEGTCVDVWLPVEVAPL